MKKNYLFIQRRIFLSMFAMLTGSFLYGQQTYTFTNCNAVGRFGPTQAQANTAYASTNLNGQVGVTNGIQTWTVPFTGPYRITGIGAQGGNCTTTNYNGGLGAYMQGDFTLTANTVLNIIVGQHGENSQYNTGGGGGSFVWITGQGQPLIAAGGGGGAGYSANGVNASTTTAGTGGTGGLGSAGTNGNGANPGGGGWFTVGANYNSNVTSCSVKCTGGTVGITVGGATPTTAIGLHGCAGTSDTGDGGFGGASGGSGYCTSSFGGGGGGGYSGGVGQSGSAAGGGGGGSYNGGTNPVNTAGFNSGNGKVIITELCNISLTAAGGTNSLTPAICSGQSLTLTTNAVSNYSWSTGVTGTNQIIVSPTTNTVYTVAGTSSLSCNAARSITVTVSSGSPVVSMSATSNSICLGDSISISASGALTYTFHNGVVPNSYFTPSLTTTYSVTGENGCGTSMAMVTVTVSPLAVFALANPTTVCALKPTTLTAAGATSFTWFPNSIPGQTILASPPSTMVYTVLGQTGNCYGSTTVQVNTTPNPTINITASGSVICEGESVTMQLTGADSYTWQTTGLTGTSVTVSPTAPTAYNVTGSNSTGCTGTAQHIVIVHPKPNVSASASPTLLCVGGTATLTATGANTYSWDGGATANSTTVSPSATTVYSVTGTENTNGCSSTQTVEVEVYSATISVSQNTIICPGTSVTIYAGAATSYTWANGLGSTQQISVNPPATTIYTVEATRTIGNQECIASNTVQVDLHPAASVTASSPRDAVCRNEKIVFTASGAQTYLWSNGMTAPSFTLTALSTNPFTFTVTGTDGNGCKATDAITVSVGNCTGLSEQQGTAVKLYPNPNNGIFTLEVQDQVHVVIYNSAGQVVKEIEKVKGTITIEGLNKGVYILQAQNAQGRYNTGFVVE